MKKKIVICLMAIAMVMSTVNISRAEEKSPILAGVLSWLVPGVGQYYNGRPEDITKGLIIDAVFVGGIVLVVIAASSAINSAQAGTLNYGSATSDTGLAAVGLVLILADGIFGIVDAILSADDINRKASKKANADFGINTAMFQDSSSRLVPGAMMSLKF